MYCSHERVALSSSLRLKLAVIEKMENPTCFQIVTNYGCLNNNHHCHIHHRWYHRVPQQES